MTVVQSNNTAIMLNGVLLVGVPMAALLMAAIYIYTKTTQSQAYGAGGSAFHRDSWGTAHNRPSSATARRRRNRRAIDRNNDQTTQESPDSRLTEDDQCEICFEEMHAVKKVQLYPCNHSDICLNCVMKLLMSNQRQCPFCRSSISGYIELESGARFG